MVSVTVEKSKNVEPDLFPGPCAVGFAGPIDSSLILAKMHQSGGQTTKVGYIVIK